MIINKIYTYITATKQQHIIVETVTHQTEVAELDDEVAVVVAAITSVASTNEE